MDHPSPERPNNARDLEPLPWVKEEIRGIKILRGIIMGNIRKALSDDDHKRVPSRIWDQNLKGRIPTLSN